MNNAPVLWLQGKRGERSTKEQGQDESAAQTHNVAYASRGGKFTRIGG
jgi:hypothetical protein